MRHWADEDPAWATEREEIVASLVALKEARAFTYWDVAHRQVADETIRLVTSGAPVCKRAS